MTLIPSVRRSNSACRWLALLLAGLVFGTAVAGAAHAADLGRHAFGDVCEICAVTGNDGGAIPVTADQPQTDARHPLVAATLHDAHAVRIAGGAQPRAPPA